jgi:hypothetical protein
LPRTATNLALTDIRAQHPNATGAALTRSSSTLGRVDGAFMTIT